MKLAITQVVLGIIIILAAFWVTGWMIHEAPGLFTQPLINDSGKTSWVDVVPENGVQFSIARYSSYALPFFGIFLVIAASVYAARGKPVKSSLAFTHVIIGLLTAAIAYFIISYGYPTSFRAVQPNEHGLLMLFESMYGGWTAVIRELSSAILFISGLAAVGVGIAQLVKSKKTTI
jgi:hypothetical protein